MSAQRPNIRDEDWRYADAAVLERLSPATFEDWRDAEVPAGEARYETLVMDAARPALHRLRVKVGEGGRFGLFAVNAGGDYSRLEAVVHLAQGAHFEFGGVTIGGGHGPHGGPTREFVTRIDHAHPAATSRQVIRAVHWGEATGNFLGRIDVGRDAQRTDAAQDFKGLLLSRGATANAKPELQIYADDVVCAHGAAIGQLDEMARYYMASRGIGPELAKSLLVRAFIADAFVALDDEAERERLTGVALDMLGDAA